MEKARFQPDCVIGISPGYLRDNPVGRAITRQIHEDYKGRLDIFESHGKGEHYAGSSTFGLFAVDQRARKYGARAMLPEESELLIIHGVNKKGTYKDLGAVLDFSGNDHELALWLYDRLNKKDKDFDRLPAILTGLETVLHDNAIYGLALQPGEHYDMRTAKILAVKGGSFEDSDPNLIVEGVPSKLGKGQRTLYTNSQSKPSIDNLGLSGFGLDWDLDLLASHGLLAYSDSGGRVILVGNESKQDYAVLLANHKAGYISGLEKLKSDIEKEIASHKIA